MAHRVLVKTIQLASGEKVDLMYWAEGNRIYVAGFQNGVMVTAATYSAEVAIADELFDRFREPLIESLIRVAEGDLMTNPGLHYRPIK